MYNLIFALLFLKPSIKKKDLPGQIGRLITGFLISFLLFYFGNVDRSISLIIATLWIPAIFQVVFALVGGAVRKWEQRDNEGLIAIVTIVMFLGSIFYNSYPYITGGAKNLSKMVNVKESTEKVSKIAAEHVIVIAPETAYYEMQKMLGSLPNPSAYKIGELGVTMSKGEACYIAPIEVDGNIKALSKGEIPGVMYVSAERPEEAKIINVTSKVANSLVFSKDLQRYLRKNKPSVILFQANAELDDEGNPYFIGSYGHYKYGRTGQVIEGVLLVSFKDGKVTDYPKNKVPEWVDEIYPSDVAENYNSYFGTLTKGLFNKIISKDGVHVPTTWASETTVNGLQVNSNEVTGVIDADGRMKWFTDHTNTSEASTTMTGYSLMEKVE